MWDNLDFVYKALNWTMPNKIKAPTAKLPQVLPTKEHLWWLQFIWYTSKNFQMESGTYDANYKLFLINHTHRKSITAMQQDS